MSSTSSKYLMKKDKQSTLEKKIKVYSDEFVEGASINLAHNPKKIARKLFSNEINITKSYLIKFIKYYVDKSEKYQYMKNDSRFDMNNIIHKMLKKLPAKRTMNRLDFYDFASECFMEQANVHPIYSDIAARIVVHKLHKVTSPSIKHVVNKLRNQNLNIKGHIAPLVSKEYYEIVMKHHRAIQSKIDMSRDYLFDYFGIQTLLRAYVRKFHRTDWIKRIERPQHLWMRVAFGIHGWNLDAAFKTYDAMSLRFMTHATPTLFNSGTMKPQMSSCYLNGVGDNIESISDLFGECMRISKWAGGIGTHLSSVRAYGSLIRGTNGRSSGIIPLCRVLNELAKYINQGGKRKGSIAVYLEPWHADIEDFIELRSIKGSETTKARDLYLAMWVPDLFMKRVHEGKMWSLMCPDDCPGLNDVHSEDFEKLYEEYEAKGLYRKQIPASDLMRKIMEMQIETGFPYFLFKDSANRKSNQQNLGTIKSSNLCVAGDTKIMTKDGIYDIKDLEDEKVRIWNGFEFSKVLVKKTGTDQNLHKIEFSNGETLHCTPYHKFYIQERYGKKAPMEIRADDLKKGMKIIKHNFPLIKNKGNKFKYSYTHGFFCADGTYDCPKNPRQCNYAKTDDTNYCVRHQFFEGCKVDRSIVTDQSKCNGVCGEKRPKVYLCGKKKNLLKHIKTRKDCSVRKTNGNIDVSLPQDMDEKYVVPYNYDVKSRVKWLEGYCDGDGCLTNNNGCQSIHVTSINKNFLLDIRKLINSLGTDCKVTLNKELLPDGRGGEKFYNCKPLYRLTIPQSSLNKLTNLGFSPKRLKIREDRANRNATQFIKITSVTKNNKVEDTYCFNEKKRHYGVFNGILTGQCAEIIEYSDEKETAVCNLASLCLPRFARKMTDEEIKDRDGADEKAEKKKDDDKENEDIENVSHGSNKSNKSNKSDKSKKKNKKKKSKKKFSRNMKFDHELLGEYVRIAVQNLNKVIDRNFYPTDSTRESNLKHRPMGIGVQGLADLYNIMGYAFDSKNARKLNKEIFETIYYYALDESMRCAKDDGPYSSYRGSPISKGKLQWHMWGLKESDLLMGYNWTELLANIKQYGVRNSLLIALMPTASTSQIMGNSECIEPYMSNVFVRSTLAGEYMVVNKNLMNDLEDLGMLTDDIIKKIIIYNGSVQEIKEIPSHIRKIYKTAFEIDPKTIIKQSAERGPFVCQSQSLNHFIAQPSYDVLYKTLRSAWREGLKTGMYYYRGVPSINPIQFGIDIDTIKRLTGNDDLVKLLTSTKNEVTFKNSNTDSEDEGGNGIDKKKKKKKKHKKSKKYNRKTQVTPMVSLKNATPNREIEECLVCGS